MRTFVATFLLTSSSIAGSAFTEPERDEAHVSEKLSSLAPALDHSPPARWTDATPIELETRFRRTMTGRSSQMESVAEILSSDPRSLVERGLPEHVGDRSRWANEIVGALNQLRLIPTADRLCAVVAVIGQESGFRDDPVIPDLPKIAWAEIERLRAKFNIPEPLTKAIFAMRSPNGLTYKARIDSVRTESDLNSIYEDVTKTIPLGPYLRERLNPVQTLGVMQVSIDFIESYIAKQQNLHSQHRTPRLAGFSRTGSILFGAAHLFDYIAPYDAMIFRFADYNVGRYASRNTAFQNAIARVAGVRLALDGILLPHHGYKAAGETLRASLALGRRLGLDESQIEDALKLGSSTELERTEFYRLVFTIADRRAGRILPRALLPQIRLQGPKIRRTNLTTAWFAQRVDVRYRSCLLRIESTTRQIGQSASTDLSFLSTAR